VTFAKVENPTEPFVLGPDGTRFVKVGKRFVRVVQAL
jgi:hypothetical protein